MIRTRTISMDVNKMMGDTFDSILALFPKIVPDAKINSDGWWSFIGPYGKSKVKFNQNKSLGILDHEYVDEESSWKIPMRVIPNGDVSEVGIRGRDSKKIYDMEEYFMEFNNRFITERKRRYRNIL